MTPLHQLFAILHIDPGLIPADLKIAGSLYADAKLIRASITIQTPHLPQLHKALEPDPVPSLSMALPAHNTTHTPPDHQSPAQSPALDPRYRLRELRKLWNQLPNDTERARFAGRVFYLED